MEEVLQVMYMPVAYFTEAGSRLSLEGEALVLRPADKDNLPKGPFREKVSMPLTEISHVLIDSGVNLTTPALRRLLENGIPVTFIRQGHLPVGEALPWVCKADPLARQLDAVRDPETRIALGRDLISAKIRNMRRLMQRMSQARRESARTLPLGGYLKRVAGAGDLASLRGWEGLVTRSWFRSLGKWFPESLPFAGRNRRPPTDPPNAMMSYLYTLLFGVVRLALIGEGLHPGWGFFHASDNRRSALALDLMEPFRAPAVDVYVLDLCLRNRIGRADFGKSSATGAVVLSR